MSDTNIPEWLDKLETDLHIDGISADDAQKLIDIVRASTQSAVDVDVLKSLHNKLIKLEGYYNNQTVVSRLDGGKSRQSYNRGRYNAYQEVIGMIEPYLQNLSTPEPTTDEKWLMGDLACSLQDIIDSVATLQDGSECCQKDCFNDARISLKEYEKLKGE